MWIEDDKEVEGFEFWAKYEEDGKLETPTLPPFPVLNIIVISIFFFNICTAFIYTWIMLFYRKSLIWKLEAWRYKYESRKEVRDRKAMPNDQLVVEMKLLIHKVSGAIRATHRLCTCKFTYI